MRAEYRREDLGPLVRGKYAARYAKSTNVVVIDPSLTRVFPNSEAVNDALRSLMTVATAVTGLTNKVRSRLPRSEPAVGRAQITCRWLAQKTSPESLTGTDGRIVHIA